GDVALLPLRGPGGEGSVDGESAHRQGIAVASVDYAEHVALELGRSGGERGRHFGVTGDFVRHGDFEEVGQRCIHGTQVLLDDLVTLLAVEIGRAHVWTPVTDQSRLPSSA